MEAVLDHVKIDEIKISKTNPRKNFDPSKMMELVESVKRLGVLQPVLVRPQKNGYELVAGERRFRAAKEAGLEFIPANVRVLSDEKALEIQVIENMDRQDLHPMEEAEGFRQLIHMPGYDAAKIAERIGRSVQYVYDRMKLVDLIEPLKKLFQENRITAGHAILLSRLSPADQKRASDKDLGGLWQEEEAHFEEIVGKSDGYKLVSVRELQQWIDEYCRFVPERDADPMLFPETAELLKSADPKKKSDKIVPISHGYVQDSARNGEKHIAPTSWKRADGKKGSKTCDFSVIGVVIAGEERAQAFRVCTNKEKCATHWGEWQKARAKTRKMSATGDQAGLQKQREKAEREQKEQEAKQERIETAMPAIRAVITKAIKSASAKPGGVLSDFILDTIDGNQYHPLDKKIKALLSIGKTSEDLVRYAAFLVIMWKIDDGDVTDLDDCLKGFKIDLVKLLEEVAPIEKTEVKKSVKKK